MFFLCTDNPLVCACELTWFANLLKELKNRDDEMNQKKRPMCTMLNEHREYFVQSMPLERMNCVPSNPGGLHKPNNGVIVTSTALIYTVVGTMCACLI